MNWYKISNTCPLAFSEFEAWYNKTHINLFRLQVKGDEEQSELWAVDTSFEVEVIDPRDCYDFFDGLEIFIGVGPVYYNTPVNYDYEVSAWEPDVAFEAPEYLDSRQEAEAEAFTYAFGELEKHINQSKQTVNNN